MTGLLTSTVGSVDSRYVSTGLYNHIYWHPHIELLMDWMSHGCIIAVYHLSELNFHGGIYRARTTLYIYGSIQIWCMPEDVNLGIVSTLFYILNYYVKLMLKGRWHGRWHLCCMLSQNIIIVNERKKNLGAFAVSGPQIWNSLPLTIRQSRDNLLLFKHKLKAHLFQQFWALLWIHI